MHFNHYDKVFNYAALLLRELAVDEDIRQEIFDNSGLDAILEAMDAFPMEEECQITGCAFLSLVLRNRKIFRDLVERDVVVLVINATAKSS